MIHDRNEREFAPPTDCAFIGAIIGWITDLVGTLGAGAVDVGADTALGAVGAGAGEAAATAAGAGALDAGATALGADALGTGALGLGADALGGLADAGSALADTTAGGLGTSDAAAALGGTTGLAPAGAAPAIGSALPASAGSSAAGLAAPGSAAQAASTFGADTDLSQPAFFGAQASSPAAVLPATPTAAGALPGGGIDLATTDAGAPTASGAFPASQVTAALQGSETSPAAASTVANATAGANAINEVPALASGSGNSLSNLFAGSDTEGSLLHGVVNNPGLDIGALGLGYDLLKGSTPLPGQAALNTEATNLANQGNQLESYLQTGTLPPGVQASINQATQAAIASVKSRYAQTGGDTSAEAQDIASIQQQAAAQGATIATQLLQQGVSETQLSSELYGQLLNLAQTQDQQLGQAIGNLSIAAAGVPKIYQVQTTS